MRASALKHTKEVLIKNLRGFLFNHENYEHIYSKDYSRTIIFDKDPQELRSFPAIVIVGSGGQMITGGLADFAEEIYDKYGNVSAYRYSGMYEFNISIDIGTRSTTDRERLTDLVSLALRSYLRRYMEREGIIIKDMRYSAESEVPYDSDKIYVSSIQLTTWSEWFREVDLLDVQDINLYFDDSKLPGNEQN